MTDNIGEYLPVSETAFEYEGPLELCDREAMNEATNNAKLATTNAKNANNVATNANTNAVRERGMIEPQIKAELAGHGGMDPNAAHAALTAAEGGTGGATASLMGQGNLTAARTHNTGGASSLLDTLARTKAQGGAGASERIGSDVAKSNLMAKQGGLGAAQGMYGTDVSQQMKAMGLVPEDLNASSNALNTRLNAEKTGWQDTVMKDMKMAKQGAQTAQDFMQMFGPGGGSQG